MSTVLTPCVSEGLADEELVFMARRGALEATDILARRYRPILERQARALRVAGNETDDLVQEGLLGLCGAIRQYRPERLKSFRPFAEICAIRRMCTARRAAQSPRNTALNRAISLHTLGCDVAVGMDVYGAIGLFSDAELTDLERAAVSLIASGFTYSEIAEQLDCPAKRVDNAVQRARRKLWRSMRS